MKKPKSRRDWRELEQGRYFAEPVEVDLDAFDFGFRDQETIDGCVRIYFDRPNSPAYIVAGRYREGHWFVSYCSKGPMYLPDEVVTPIEHIMAVIAQINLFVDRHLERFPNTPSPRKD